MPVFRDPQQKKRVRAGAQRRSRVGISWTTCLMLALAEPIFVYSRAFSSSPEQCLVGAWMKYFAKEEGKQEGFVSSDALYYVQNHSQSSDIVCIPFQFRAVFQLL